jgi:hypothetical protein
MVRAGVFIGVDKSGDLQKLNDATAGATRMHEWALEQGMAEKTYAKLLTDVEGETLMPDDSTDAVHDVLHFAYRARSSKSGHSTGRFGSGAMLFAEATCSQPS